MFYLNPLVSVNILCPSWLNKPQPARQLLSLFRQNIVSPPCPLLIIPTVTALRWQITQKNSPDGRITTMKSQLLQAFGTQFSGFFRQSTHPQGGLWCLTAPFVKRKKDIEDKILILHCIYTEVALTSTIWNKSIEHLKLRLKRKKFKDRYYIASVLLS